MLECEQPGAVITGIAADAQVVWRLPGGANQVPGGSFHHAEIRARFHGTLFQQQGQSIGCRAFCGQHSALQLWDLPFLMRVLPNNVLARWDDRSTYGWPARILLNPRF